MKMIDPTARSPTSASWSSRPTKAGIPPLWPWNFPRRWWFSTPPSGRRCPSCSPPATPCRRTRRSAASASPSPFPRCGSRRTRNEPPLREFPPRPSHRRLLTTGEPCMNKRDESCVSKRRTHPLFTHFLRRKQLAAT